MSTSPIGIEPFEPYMWNSLACYGGPIDDGVNGEVRLTGELVYMRYFFYYQCMFDPL